jgi:anti-anti-sigma factor
MTQVFDSTHIPSTCLVEEQWFDTTVVVHCSGEVDMLTAPDLERRIADVLTKEPKALIVDLTAVEFLASQGMSVLIKTHDLVTPQIEFSVVADGPATSRPMTLIGLADVFTIHPTLDAALGAGAP